MNKPIKTIMIVEDEAIISFDMKMILESNGFQVHDVVSSGKKALEIFNDQKPDAVLVDINLHGAMSGIDFCKTLLENDSHPIVIYITGYTDTGLIQEAKKTLPRAIFEKPIDMDELIQTLHM